MKLKISNLPSILCLPGFHLNVNTGVKPAASLIPIDLVQSFIDHFHMEIDLYAYVRARLFRQWHQSKGHV